MEKRAVDNRLAWSRFLVSFVLDPDVASYLLECTGGIIAYQTRISTKKNSPNERYKAALVNCTMIVVPAIIVVTKRYIAPTTIAPRQRPTRFLTILISADLTKSGALLP